MKYAHTTTYHLEIMRRTLVGSASLGVFIAEVLGFNRLGNNGQEKIE